MAAPGLDIVIMIYLHSSAIVAVEYDDRSWTLYIQFQKNSKIYSFYHVPLEIYQGLVTASSHGKFYAAYIRGRYSA